MESHARPRRSRQTPGNPSATRSGEQRGQFQRRVTPYYSNDHAPIHVHVRRGGEAVFVVEPEVELRESVGFNVRELSRAEDLIDDHLELIKQKWAEHLG